MQKETPLFQKVYDLCRLFYSYLNHFPKQARFVLGQRIEKALLDLLELISRASFAKSRKKAESLEKASLKVDFLKILFRLSYDLKIIDQKKYLELQRQLQEIGKMLGGWLKSCQR